MGTFFIYFTGCVIKWQWIFKSVYGHDDSLTARSIQSTCTHNASLLALALNQMPRCRTGIILLLPKNRQDQTPVGVLQTQTQGYRPIHRARIASRGKNDTSGIWSRDSTLYHFATDSLDNTQHINRNVNITVITVSISARMTMWSKRCFGERTIIIVLYNVVCKYTPITNSNWLYSVKELSFALSVA